MTANYKRLEEYFDPRMRLEDHAEKLSDPRTLRAHDREKINPAVMAFTVKYLLEYLQIISRDIETIRRGVRKLVDDQVKREFSVFSHGAMGGRRDITSDVFAVQCLADTQGTAALVKEIAFGNDGREVYGEFAVGDLGTGTGILFAAGLIGGLRRNAQSVFGCAIDSQANAVKNAERVLKKIPRTKSTLMQGDITNLELYRIFAPPIRVRQWISETINTTTPSMEVSRTGIRSSDATTIRASRRIDPYMDVVHNLLHLPQFYRDVEQRDADMFPNVITGDYQPDGNGGKLALKTSMNPALLPLRNVGDEFVPYEGFGRTRRWH